MSGVARLVAALAAALVLVGCGQPAPPTGTSVPEPAIRPGSTGTVELGDRPFGLHVPSGYDRTRPTALVVALHGYTSNATEAYDFFGLAAADPRGILVALPEGSANPQGERFWNASAACCDFSGSGVDDVAYLTGVIEKVGQGYAVDPRRVFVVGHSNGGFMALRLACDAADVVAAVASVAGAMDVDGECAPAVPVSVLQVHGDSDDTIGIEGGEINHAGYTSAAVTTGRWRELDACPAGGPEPGPELDADADVPGDDLTRQGWTGCASGSEVALWTIGGGGHVPSLTPAFTAALLDWSEANARG
ncbi:MAG: PHB depolymerase family esterase [Propionicimonas sp.]|nr:PHB depolymerase family esterase [Propionicimonas sp.]